MVWEMVHGNGSGFGLENVLGNSLRIGSGNGLRIGLGNSLGNGWRWFREWFGNGLGNGLGISLFIILFEKLSYFTKQNNRWGMAWKMVLGKFWGWFRE